MSAADKIYERAFELWLKDHPNYISVYEERIAFSYSLHYEDGYTPLGKKYINLATEEYERSR